MKRSPAFIQLNQNHLLQNNTIVAHDFNLSVSSSVCDAAPSQNLLKPEDIPLSITRVRKSNKKTEMYDDDIDYMYEKHNQSVYYSTMNPNGNDYSRRKSNSHLHRHSNINSYTNRYRWYNHSDGGAQQSPSTTKVDVTTMNPDQHAHTAHHRQNHLNQINNNFVVTNKKHSMTIHSTGNDHNIIDQINGNNFPSRH